MRRVSFPLDDFLKSVEDRSTLRVPGVAVFMTGNPRGVPPALLHNLKHNKALHERVVLLTVGSEDVPYVRPEERVTVQRLDHGFWRVVARYGYMEDPSVPELLKQTKSSGLDLRMMETTFFLGRETLLPAKRPEMALWRARLFAWMSKNARAATAFFDLPPNRVVELGAQIEL
jgi:KUP system potassium uptake protein